MGLKIYEDDLQRNKQLKSFDKDQKVRMEALIYTRKGERPLDCIKEVLTYMDELNKRIEDEISECKGRIQTARKGKKQKISAKSEEHFDELVEKFSDISEQMMELCTDIFQYANSARETHSCIEKVIKSTRELKVKDYKNIFNELQKLKKKDTTADLIEKINSLRISNENMLKRLKRNSDKLHKELQSCGAFKTVTNMMFMAATAGVVICAILAVALASNPLVPTVVGIVTAACEITAAGKHWIVEYTKKWDDNVKARQAQNKAMQDATRDSIDHLNAIEDCIGRVLTEIDTLLLLDGNSKNEGGEGSAMELDKNHQINEKIKKFLSAINDLEKKTKDCENHIMETRRKIKKDNRNVKTTT